MMTQNILEIFIKPVNAGGLSILGKLAGIGYREPDL